MICYIIHMHIHLVVERLGAREEDVLQRDIHALNVVPQHEPERDQILVGHHELAAQVQQGDAGREVDVALCAHHGEAESGLGGDA